METLLVNNAMARVDLSQAEVDALLEVMRESLHQGPVPRRRDLLESLEAHFARVTRQPDWATGRAADADEGRVETRDDLAAFVTAMHADLVAHPGEWENHNLERFLEALSAYIEAVEQAYRNKGQRVPDPPTWQLFALILKCASEYE